jgi:hypothetical protein
MESTSISATIRPERLLRERTTRLRERSAAASSTSPTTAARQQQVASSSLWRHLYLQARLLHAPAPSKPLAALHGTRPGTPPTHYHQCAPRAMSRTTEMALLLRSRRRAGASALASHLLRSAPCAQRHLRALSLPSPAAPAAAPPRARGSARAPQLLADGRVWYGRGERSSEGPEQIRCKCGCVCAVKKRLMLVA